MHILGISCYYHDAAAALIRDGELIAAAEEERFSRVKHDPRFPVHAIRFCLERAGIEGQELDYVVFYEKPFDKFERILSTSLQTFPKSYRLFRESMATWLVDKLWVRQTIQSHLGIPQEKVLFSEHHLSHAASAFYASPFEEAAILTVDGVGEWTTAAYGVGIGNSIALTKEMRFPHSVGLLYSAFTAFLGFEVNEGEYKVMGMAPYGSPRYVDEVWKTVNQFDDGSVELDMDYFCFHHSTTRSFTKKLESLLGEPREPESLFFTEETGFPTHLGADPGDFGQQCERNAHFADIAASIQQVTEEILLKMVEVVLRDTGQTNLCMAGGVALNSVANGRLSRESGLERLFVQPAAGDGGGALGAALHIYHGVLHQPRSFVMTHGYWGADYTEEEEAEALADCDLNYDVCKDEDEAIIRTTRMLAEGKVIGWFQGRFEWGPRALGNRSILADPRSITMKDRVNARIKFREPFRPFAPAVLQNAASSFFATGDESRETASFMLSVHDVRPERRDDLPATTHIDGSARVQVVDETSNPRFYRLVEAFGEATDVPVVLNTSYNLRGEPIVASPADACSTFLRSDLDALVMGNHIVTKAPE